MKNTHRFRRLGKFDLRRSNPLFLFTFPLLRRVDFATLAMNILLLLKTSLFPPFPKDLADALKTNSKCPDNLKESDACMSLSALTKIQSVTYRNSGICIKRGGISATTYQNAWYVGRPHFSDLGACPAATKLAAVFAFQIHRSAQSQTWSFSKQISPL